MMNLETLTPQDFWQVAVRRKWIIIFCLMTTTAIAGALCIMLPKSYRSSTVILVENQKIPESYVNSVVGGTVADRLSSIRQLVLSRTVLSQVIEEFKLQGTNQNIQDKEDAIEVLRKKIMLETKASPGSGRVDSFSISYAHRDPHVAMQVTAKLASQFIEENLKVREQLVEGTSDFLEQELRHAKASLEEQEEALAQFRKKYLGELPGQTDANLSTLNRLQRELALVNESLQNRTDRKANIQKMIHVYETMGEALYGGASSDMSTKPDNNPQFFVRPSQKKDNDPLVMRLKELERSLMGLSAEYKETYPDIILTKQEINQIKAKLAARDKEEGEHLEESKPKIAGERKQSAMNPVDPYLYELKRERDESEVGVASLREQQRRLVEQIHDYQLRVERAPEREQELSILERDYENTKKNYQTLLDKRLNAQISQNLEKYQKGEKFRILDPANLPAKPESPDVMKIMLAGLILGCSLGYGTAFGLEYMRGVIRRPEDAESLLGLPVFATIPNIETAYETGMPNKKQNHAWLRTYRPVNRPLLQGAVEEARMGGLIDSEKSMTGSGAVNVKQELNLVAKWRPQSMVAEQYRVAATRLVLSSSGQKSSVIVVTSALKGEGKSTTVSNLAYVLAHDLGKRTLLIDCDFKCPMLHEYTGTPSSPGLAEAIFSDVPLDNCIHRHGESLLWILPSGGRNRQLVDLTKIPQLSRLLDEFRGQYEYIILDAPPILPLADMNLLSSMADMLVMVVRSGITAQDILLKAVKSLKVSSRAGIILNGSDVNTTPKYLREYYRTGLEAYSK